MKIGFDVSQTGKGKAGCGFFADSLIRALEESDSTNEYIYYPTFGYTYWDEEWRDATFRSEKSNFTKGVGHRTFEKMKSFWDSPCIDGEAAFGNPDIIHANNFSCPRFIENARIVYTLYDLSFMEHPEFTTTDNRWTCFRGLLDAVSHADFIISISNYSILKFLDAFPGFPQERLKVIYPGTRFSPNRETGKKPLDQRLEPDKFWLSVCTLEPRKNIRRLLKAFSIFNRDVKEKMPLALVGGKGWMEEGLEDYIRGLGLEEHVILPGYVPDEELAWLYGNCFAFLYPSLYEGFGMPALEAMSMGAAVVTSNNTSMPEFAGDAVRYVDPYDTESIAWALFKVARDIDFRNTLKMSGIERAREYTWRRCADQVREVYETAAALPKKGSYLK